jgi:hypothetical protein
LFKELSLQVTRISYSFIKNWPQSIFFTSSSFWHRKMQKRRLQNCQIWRFWKCKISKIWTRFWRFQAQKFLNVKTSNLMVFIKRKMFPIVLRRRFCFRCFHKPFRKFKIRCFQPYVRKSATIVGSTCPVTLTHTQKVVACKWVVVQHTHTQKNAFKKPKPKSVRVKLSNFKIFEFVFVKSS